MENKNYCMSSFLSFRFIKDEDINFFPGLSHKVFKPRSPTLGCSSADELDAVIKSVVEKEYIQGKTGVFLSGGIDSAIVASYMPEGTPAYTFKCIADGAIDETAQAAKYAERYKLQHIVLEMHWDDFLKYTPALLKYNQVPFHSIEVQLYKAALTAKRAGMEKIFIGESADLIYGGMDQLLSKDWEFDQFVKRYTFVEPEKALNRPVSMLDTFERYRDGGRISLLKFMDEIFSIESSTSYMHAFGLAELPYIDPYSFTHMSTPLDLSRVRNGEPKYLVRELFRKRYPGIAVPDKITMPRAMDQWLKHWEGPKRHEFIPGCVHGMTGDQKWLVYCLEQFLNMFDPEK